MKILKFTLCSLLAMFLLHSCGGNATHEGLTGRVTLEDCEGKMVYLETTGITPLKIDSAVVKEGRFAFAFTDSVPQVYQLALRPSQDDMFPIILPVVSEKGHIKVLMGERVLTSGTPLNDSLQDFLLAVSNFYDDAMKQENLDMDQLKADFSKLVEGTVIQNINTPVGVYVYKNYGDRLSDSQKEYILSHANNGFKEAVE